MGCGSSSLKGDAPQGLNNNNDDAAVDNRPIRKVATNFATVDYEQENNQERRNTAYAPHETERTPSATSDAIRHARNGIAAKDEEQLKPYQSIDAGNPLTSGGGGVDEQLKPYQSIDVGKAPPPTIGDGVGVSVAPTDPTSTTAKDNFASANDPAASQQEQQPLITEDGNKSSWQNKNIKEDDLIKYTGKSKDEVLEMVDRGDGVGRGQPADSRYTATDALGTGVV